MMKKICIFVIFHSSLTFVCVCVCALFHSHLTSTYTFISKISLLDIVNKRFLHLFIISEVPLLSFLESNIRFTVIS